MGYRAGANLASHADVPTQRDSPSARDCFESVLRLSFTDGSPPLCPASLLGRWCPFLNPPAKLNRSIGSSSTGLQRVAASGDLTKGKPFAGVAESARATGKHDVAPQFRLEPVESREPRVSHIWVARHPWIVLFQHPRP